MNNKTQLLVLEGVQTNRVSHKAGGKVKSTETPEKIADILTKLNVLMLFPECCP